MSMRSAAEAAGYILGGGVLGEMQGRCLGASGEHTYRLGCVRIEAAGAGNAMLRVVDAGRTGKLCK